MFPVLLAHGALGWWDDLIFLGIIVLFVGMMIVSWFTSRDENFETDDLMPQSTQETDNPERFQLD